MTTDILNSQPIKNMEDKQPMDPEQFAAMETGEPVYKYSKKVQRKIRKKAGLSFSDILKEKTRQRNLKKVHQPAKVYCGGVYMGEAEDIKISL